MEEAEKRKENEKSRRIIEQEKLYQEKQAVSSKLAAQNASKTLLKNMIPNVVTALTANGYFYDAIQREVEESFLPWLSTQVSTRLSDEVLAYLILDGRILLLVHKFLDLIRDAVNLIEGNL